MTMRRLRTLLYRSTEDAAFTVVLVMMWSCLLGLIVIVVLLLSGRIA